MNRTKRWAAGATAALALLAGGACSAKSSPISATPARVTSDLPQGSEVVKIDPSTFSTTIDNPWWPMAVGSHWLYRELDSEGGDRRVNVTVTNKTKKLANGVTVRVVHDAVTEKDGTPVEITNDYYAQDDKGNLWYMGEDTAEYENGKVTSRAGSFEAGTHGAQGGIAIPAQPAPGMKYRQEYAKGQAEDNGEILKTDAQAEVPAGHYDHTVFTMDTNPLEPKNLEFKMYARGVGPVLELSASGGSDRAELVKFTPGT